MCGGISSALSISEKNSGGIAGKLPIAICYNLGRLLSYASIGAGVWLLSNLLVSQFAPLFSALRILAGLLLILMGLYLANWSRLLAQLEAVGTPIWKFAQRIVGKFSMKNKYVRALLMGAVWGWLPCGLVYSTLSWAAATASPSDAALLMLAFGVGTMPAMLATGFFASKLTSFLRQHSIRKVTGTLIMLFGVWTIAAVFLISHNEHAAHGEQSPGNHATHHN